MTNTTYFIGTEDVHFIPIGVPSVDATGGGTGLGSHFRSDWARCALQCGVGPATDERWRAPLANMSISTGEFWWTARINQTGIAVFGTTSLVDFLSGSAVTRLRLVAVPGAAFKLYRVDDDLSLNLIYTGTIPGPSASRLSKIDIYVNIGSGVFQAYADRVPVVDFTGDLTNSGEYSTVTGFDLRGGNGGAVFSEVVWQTDDTRKIVGVRSIWPYGDGHALEWTGAKTDVNEITLDDMTANYTDTGSLLQEYTVPPLPATLTDNVVVSAVMLGMEVATNPVDAALLVRTHSAEYYGTTRSTSGVPERDMDIWDATNPATGLGWTKDELNAADFNIGVASV